MNIPGETSATLGNIRASDNYSVVVCNEGGCTTSREARVSVLQGPHITQQPPPSTTACVGTPVTLHVVVALSALPSTFFQWTRNGQPLSGATSSTLFIASAQPSDAATYRVVVNDNGCAVTSAPCVLTVTGSALGAELTEGNAAEWCAFASDAAATSLANDPTRARSGQYSLRLDTASGFDTGVRFPCEPTAHWDLLGHDYLEFWSYAENSWPSGFQGNQPVIVLRTTTGVFRYEPPDRLATNNAWSHFRVPLAGDSFWRRTATNYPTLGDVNQIEIHQDTWDHGFVIYYDGVRFTRGSECPRLRLEPPRPVGNDRYRITLARVDGLPFYTNSPPVVDLRASARVVAPWDEWLRLPTSSLRVEDGRLVAEHTSFSSAQFYYAADRSALRFDVPATTNFGGLGLLPGKFVYPQGMSIGAGGELHVVDDTGGGVQVFDKDTLLFKRRYATNLIYPNDVAVDAAGYSYVSEYGDTIGAYAPDGSWLRTLNLGLRSWPEGLAIDPTSGNLVVAGAPTEAARISVWTPGGTLVRSWAPVTGAEDVWVSAAGEVFASASGGVYRYSSTGVLLGQFVPRHRAAAICGDDTGILYVTYFDHESVDAYSLTGELQASYEMMPCALDLPYSGFTFGVTYSGPNQLFVTDRATHKVARLKIVRQRCSDCGQ